MIRLVRYRHVGTETIYFELIVDKYAVKFTAHTFETYIYLAFRLLLGANTTWPIQRGRTGVDENHTVSLSNTRAEAKSYRKIYA